MGGPILAPYWLVIKGLERHSGVSESLLDPGNGVFLGPVECVIRRSWSQQQYPALRTVCLAGDESGCYIYLDVLDMLSMSVSAHVEAPSYPKPWHKNQWHTTESQLVDLTFPRRHRKEARIVLN